ncbi:MAG: uroporphyrinogen-III synthase [Chromatiales bacterium]|jgi:uroporphyrinogen-III synthase|nr:uroporphyrinogen-III synthase [Chromatiales bacterium]
MLAERAEPLAGTRILVTRPAHQAQALCELIRRDGGEALALPVIEIAPPVDAQLAAQRVASVHEFDVAVFVSPNAVRSVHALMGDRPWPARTRIAAVGRGSSDALEQCGLRADIQPAGEFNSEGLLAEGALRDVQGLRVLIFRGDGGREHLTDTLRARGAKVCHAEVYRRALPEGAAATLARVAAGPALDAIIVTSNQGLQHLYAMAGETWRPWLREQQLVVISTRAAALARELGFQQVARVAPAASDAGLMEVLRQQFARQVDGRI